MLFLWWRWDPDGAWELPPDPERRVSEEMEEEFVGPPPDSTPVAGENVTLAPPEWAVLGKVSYKSERDLSWRRGGGCFT